MTEKLFVYGTLLKKHIQAKFVSVNGLRFLGEGSIAGELYSLGEYPGAVQKAGSLVYGEVYEVADAAKALRKIDKYECFSPEKPKGSIFVRKTVQVTLNDNTKTQAYAYFYNKPTCNLKKILSGKWSK